MFTFFIKNPVLSAVISIIIVLCGLVAIFNLPLAEYPNIAPPTITISAHYPGANAEVLEKTVASPIEDQINGSNQMIYMNSVMSSNGDYNLVVTFSTGTDLNAVIGDVLNRLNSALPILPQEVQNLGVTMRKSSQNLLMSLSLQSDGRQDTVYVSNYAYRAIYTELVRVKGVGDVEMVGARNYSMRIWVDPNKLAKLGLSIADVQNAINEQNVQAAVGQTGAPPTDNGQSLMVVNLVGQSYYSDPKEFENIIIRSKGTEYVRIKDVGRVELGAFSYDTTNKLDKKSTIGLQIFLDPSANQLQVHTEIMRLMQRLSRQFPYGMSYTVSFDNTKFIKKALGNVTDTLRDACILVIIVVFLFLQKARATMIPVLTIPVAVIGTFAGMYATGFSINNLTLFGLILSIGIVVDDSIVVIENVERVMHEDGLSARKASIRTMEEVASALIAIVLVLCCAFIPSAFLGGLTGILYRQFAITISMAVILSGIVALTLTPSLCAIFLKEHTKEYKPNLFFNKFNHGFEWFTNLYIDAVKFLLHKRKIFMWVFVGVLILTFYLFYILPIGFIPNEDKGFFVTQVKLPNNASLARTEEITDKYIDYLLHNKEVENVVSLIGIDQLHSGSVKTNVATVTTDLIDWDSRKHDVNYFINEANDFGRQDKDAGFIPYNQPAIDGLSNTNGIEVYIQDKVNGDVYAMDKYAHQITTLLNQDPSITKSYYSFSPYTQAYNVFVDIPRAKFYGVNINDIYNTLEAVYGPDLVNYFYRMGDLFWVTVQSDAKFRQTPYQISNLYVKNANESLVAINSLVKTEFSTAPDVIERVNDYLATKIVVEQKPGVTIQDTMKIIASTLNKVLPKEYSYTWYGVSYQQQSGNATSVMAFVFGIIMIFLVLAGQFEMWRLPVVVMMAIPFALFGAGGILFLRGLTNDLYFQISLITLLGLSAKNAILITEFAIQHWRTGINTVDSVLIAARQRFRPIIMTSLAFVLGALPLAFAHGANSNAEHSVGTGIIGGMLGSTFIATIFVPLFFVVVMGKKEPKTDEEE